MARCNWPNGLPASVSLLLSTGQAGCSSPITRTLNQFSGVEYYEDSGFTFTYDGALGHYYLEDRLTGAKYTAAVVVCCGEPNGPLFKFNNVSYGVCTYTAVITGPACSQSGGGQ
jgi:hypothetical protein